MDQRSKCIDNDKFGKLYQKKNNLLCFLILQITLSLQNQKYIQQKIQYLANFFCAKMKERLRNSKQQSKQKQRGSNQVPSSKDKEPSTLVGKLQSNIFKLQVQLNDKKLSITLKDYNDWAIYAKIYTNADIGKSISAKLELADIFYALIKRQSSGNEDREQKNPQFFTYKMGEVIKNGSNTLIIRQNGKIAVTNKIFHQRAGKMVQKIQTSNLELDKIGVIDDKKKLQIAKQIIKKQIDAQFIKQIAELKKQNKQMKQKYKQLQKEFEVEVEDEKNKNSEQITINIKDLNGGAIEVKVLKSNTIQELKEIISKKRNWQFVGLRLVFAGRQLDDEKTIAYYNIQRYSTIHVILNLRGDIGIFKEDIDIPFGRALLSEKQNLRPQQVDDLIVQLRGDPNSQYLIDDTIEIPTEMIRQIIQLVDKEHRNQIQENRSKQQTDDVKLSLSKQDLVDIIGSEFYCKLKSRFAVEIDDIVVRRCQAHGKIINFHTDQSSKTMQFSLNDESDYVGGKLLFVTKGKIDIPVRKRCTVTVHNNRIVHGVTKLQAGVRYGLFFLQK